VWAGEDTDVLIDAMKDEMARSMKSLQIEKMEKPYFLEYTVLDVWQMDIRAGFGSLTISESECNRTLKVDLRVGDYQLDNTGYVTRSSVFSAMMGRSDDIVLEDDYNAVRHDIWLATDRAYKEALEQLAAKNAFIKNQAEKETLPDFSKEKPVHAVAPRVTVKVDAEKWEKTVKDLSTVFRKFPAIHESGVEFRVKVGHKYYVNSEGTVFRQPETLVALVAHAATQAEDGMKLKHYIPFYAPTIDALPNEKELAAGVRKMAEELTALASAPVMKEYIGPVLFTGQASAELFVQMLSPHFSGRRPPLSEDARMAEMAGTPSKLASRMNRRVLPREIFVTDDPNRTSFEKQPLIGSYKIDDQGVPAVPVKLVEGGILKSLLMSRRPRKDFANSNGHARAASRGKPGVQVSNLFITAKKGKSYKELKQELMDLCRDQEMSFGLMIKSVDDPAITGIDFSITELMRRQTGGGGESITSPVMMYRVDAKTGREELVRGISVSELTVRTLKDILAVGNDSYVYHRLLSGGGMSSYFSYISALRGVRGGGIPGSIVAPSVLFEELELKKTTETRKNPPLLAHPYFSK
jgi:predicted Zn-dependent protease